MGVKRVELLNTSVTGYHRGGVQSHRLPWSVGKHNSHPCLWPLFLPPSLVAPQPRPIPGTGGRSRERMGGEPLGMHFIFTTDPQVGILMLPLNENVLQYKQVNVEVLTGLKGRRCFKTGFQYWTPLSWHRMNYCFL